MQSARPDPDLALMIACSQGDLPAMRAALLDGAALDAPAFRGQTVMDVAAASASVGLALDLQLAYQEIHAIPLWRARDGSNALTLHASHGHAGALLDAARRFPQALFSRDLEGRNPFDLFCEACCAHGLQSAPIAECVDAAARLASPKDLASALAACHAGVQTGADLLFTASAASRSSALVALQTFIDEIEIDAATAPPKAASGPGAPRL